MGVRGGIDLPPVSGHLDGREPTVKPTFLRSVLCFKEREISKLEKQLRA